MLATSCSSLGVLMQVNGWKLVTTINMCIIFFIFGITLETSELKEAFKAVKTLIMGLTSILVVTSFTGFIFINMGFQPVEFGVGLAIFACVPTSLSSGVTLVIQSYGNGALALLLTVLSNLIGIVVSPIFVKLVLGNLDAQLDTMELLIKLLVSILMPLVVGKLVREFIPPALKFAKKYKVPLYLFNNFQIIMIVWQTLSYSHHKLMEQKFSHIVLAIIGAIMQHFFFLVMNSIIAWIIRLKEVERKAYIIMASQKSLPTAAVIISYLNTDALNVGLISIPCIIFYIMQLFIDSFIASSWSGKYERADALRAKYADELEALYKMDDPETTLLLSAPTPVNVKVDKVDGHMDEDKQGLLANAERS